MEKTELTVSMEPERLDALRYFLAAKNKRTPQKELQRALEELRRTDIALLVVEAAGGIQGYTDAEGGSDRWRPLN